MKGSSLMYIVILSIVLNGAKSEDPLKNEPEEKDGPNLKFWDNLSRQIEVLNVYSCTSHLGGINHGIGHSMIE